ncbi:VCBS repeat-containing protein [Chitinophaga agrisoli]|uniref:VCBS repeat-containing protein n=2 Tax=Chitinophaga agrisoli TaxID=2607653 RepID=A0A5B2W3R3_9BACT|nr:VCBS repeat-containing protein [Chitinophaga agrisoli]
MEHLCNNPGSIASMQAMPHQQFPPENKHPAGSKGSSYLSFIHYRYLLLLLVITACGETGASIRRVKRGSQLARQYCSSCHAFPSPSLLDKTTWEKDVLPAMGARLGINTFHGSYYPAAVLSDTPGTTANIIQPDDWDKLVEYYTTVAPWQPLPQDRPQPVSRQWPHLFSIKEPAWQWTIPPLTTYVGIDTLRRQLWVADGHDSLLHIYNDQLQPLQQLHTASMVSDVVLPGKTAASMGYITCIGTLFPSDARRGSIQGLLPGQDSMQLLPAPLKDRLPRPVQTLPADFNKDGRTDLLVCGFGYNQGYLAWLEGDSTHILLPFPGAIKACIRDEDHDGLPDIWALFAQGDESIWYLHNTGNGRFEPQRILQFPPSYGSSSFTLQDLDHDGQEDILYTCGDNADLSKVLKAYHGVYIYLNKGNKRFALQYFYPVNGCYKAIARDFDMDGDLDLMTISFFADYGNQPEEALLYFENQGGFNYITYTLPASRQGHWICMDAGDIDGDGDLDVVLGNLSHGPVNFPGLGTNWERAPSFILLENNKRAPIKKD